MERPDETIADIIAWLRKPREGENGYLTAWRDEIADRLEAAIKRERGDCAKLREAVEKVIEIADREWNAFRETSAMWEMREICVAALAATEKEGGTK